MLFSCGDNDVNKPIDKGSHAPGQVSNVIVKNQSGAALLSYDLPLDDDLLYVLARCDKGNGNVVDFRASYYTNQLLIEGFGDTKAYSVDLYAVNRSGNKSKPVKVEIKPLVPQIQITAESIVMKEDFGGMNFTFENKTKADLAFIVLTEDESGDKVIAETFYSGRETAKFAVRGFTDQDRWFGIVVRDKWENHSDTLSQNLTPIYEVKLNKSLFRAKIFPNDSPATSWDGALEYMWDDVVNDKGAHTGNDSNMEPKHISFDLGVKAQLSRINLKTIPDDKHWYNDVSPRFYEIWGAEDPDSSGSFETWTKLASIENIKPSGLSLGILTEDDRIAGRNGDDADITLDAPRVRYLRIVCTRNWSGNTNMVVSEITVWGNDKN